MLLVTRFFDELEIFRVKGDGDFHELPKFGVIGGYRKIRGSKITARAMAMKLLNAFYEVNNRPPTLIEATQLADAALDEDKGKLPYSFATAFSFEN